MIIFILSLFIVGYLGIIFEFYIKLNKTAVSLVLAALCWIVYFVSTRKVPVSSLLQLGDYIGDIAQIVFFLLGAMTLVELIDSHKGFNAVLSWVQTANKRKLLLLTSFITFFLSAVLDNLTTTILMISVLRKWISDPKERLVPNCMIVIAANAGGAWTPIGDVTTTMLWINHRLSTLTVMKEIFLPSLVSMCVPLGIYLSSLKGNYPKPEVDYRTEKQEPGANLVFVLGMIGLMAVPLIKWLTGIPPFMGMLLVLAVLWIVTDCLHHKHKNRKHLRIPFILTKIDVSSILFFLGILLAINALEVVGILKELAIYLHQGVKNEVFLASIIGIISAVIDNVPLVAATMGMYDLSFYPLDAPLWLLIAFTAGVGGSMLSIGSAAGVALMGMENVHFIAYLKKATLPSLLGYFSGISIYLLQNLL